MSDRGNYLSQSRDSVNSCPKRKTPVSRGTRAMKYTSARSCGEITHIKGTLNDNKKHAVMSGAK